MDLKYDLSAVYSLFSQLLLGVAVVYSLKLFWLLQPDVL